MNRMFSKKKLIGAIAVCLIISSAFASLSCGGGKQPGFNINVGQLKTNIGPAPYAETLVLAPPWGGGDGQLGNMNPYGRGNPESGTPASGPESFHADAEGRILIDDQFNGGRTVLYDQNGSFMRNLPPNLYMASDNEGNIYFSMRKGDICIYDLEGNLLEQWNYNQKPEGWSDDKWFAGDRPVIGNDGVLYMIGKRDIDKQYRITITKWTKDGTPVSSFMLSEKATGSDVAIDEGGRIFTKGEGNVIEVYDPQGKHIKTIPVDETAGPVYHILGFDNDGSLSIILHEAFTSKGYELLKYNSDGVPIARYRLDDSQVNLDNWRVKTPYQLSANGDVFLMNVPAYSDMDKETLKIYRVDPEE